MSGKKTIRIISCIVLCAVLLCFAFFVAEFDHDCHGEEDCPICRLLTYVQSAFTVGFLAAAVVVGVSVFVLLLRAVLSTDPVFSSALVDLKTKLSE